MPTILYGLIEQRPEHPNFGHPFYIGIGTKKRPHAHFKQVRSVKGHRNPELHSIILAHFTLEIEPPIRIYATFDTTLEAAAAEIGLIARYGRVGFEVNGILCNLSRGGSGPDSELMRRPEIAARNAEAQRNRSPASKALSLAALMAAVADPVLLAKRSESQREPTRQSWLDADIRIRRTSGMRGTKKTMTPAAIAARQANANVPRSEEALAAQLAGVIRAWSDPEFRAKRSSDMTALWQDPEKRARFAEGRSEGIAKSWENPNIRASRIAGIKARAAEKSAANPKPDKPKVGRSANMTALNATFTAESRSAVQTASWSDPAVAAARKAGLKKAAQDPALKAARLAAMLEGKRRKARAAEAVQSEERG